MRTDGIHIHFFDEQRILQGELLVGGTSAVRMEAMTVYAFHDDFGAVDIKSVLRTELYGAESYPFFVYVYHLLLRIKQFQC